MSAFEHITLETARLHLRPLRGIDAPALLEMHADPVFTQYWSAAPWDSIEQAYSMIARDAAAMAAGEYLRLGLENKEDRVLIGTCTLFNLNQQCRRAEIGYGLDRQHWSQGYMNEALLALLTYGFGDMQLNRVEADIDPDNLGSARCLERLGFIREGLLRERWIVEGKVSDTALYGLLLSDWQKLQAQAMPAASR